MSARRWTAVEITPYRRALGEDFAHWVDGFGWVLTEPTSWGPWEYDRQVWPWVDDRARWWREVQRRRRPKRVPHVAG